MTVNGAVEPVFGSALGHTRLGSAHLAICMRPLGLLEVSKPGFNTRNSKQKGSKSVSWEDLHTMNVKCSFNEC